jgi:hypothetical protein
MGKGNNMNLDTVTEAMIEAGIDACQRLRDDMEARERSAHPEDMPDYDEGDVMRAIFLAMLRAQSPDPATVVLQEEVERVAKFMCREESFRRYGIEESLEEAWIAATEHGQDTWRSRAKDALSAPKEGNDA